MKIPLLRFTVISGNDLHGFMDRFSRKLRHRHREKGHDIEALIEMVIFFKDKYSFFEIFKTWMLHKIVDGWDSGFKASVRKYHKGYGKKDSTLEIINKLKKEIFK